MSELLEKENTSKHNQQTVGTNVNFENNNKQNKIDNNNKNNINTNNISNVPSYNDHPFDEIIQEDSERKFDEFNKNSITQLYDITDIYDPDAHIQNTKTTTHVQFEALPTSELQPNSHEASVLRAAHLIGCDLDEYLQETTDEYN